MIIGNAASERQEGIVVKKGTNDRDFTTSTSSNNSAVNGSAMIVKTLERCFNERIDREMSNVVDTVEDGIQNAFLTAIDNIIAPIIELAIMLINASSGWDATSVSATSECRERVWINTSFENASENNDTLGVSNVIDETRLNVSDEVSGLPVPETHFDRQRHTHHMVTGQTAQTIQFPEFLTGRIQTPRNPSSHQHQNLSTQVSQDNNLPVVEQTPRNQTSDANNSINRLSDSITGITTQQRLQAATMLKPVSTSLMGKTENSNSSKTYFT